MATRSKITYATIRLPRQANRKRHLLFAGLSVALLASCGSSSDDDKSAASVSSEAVTTSSAAPSIAESAPATDSPATDSPATDSPTTTAPSTTASVATTASTPPVAATGPAVTIFDFAFVEDKVAVNVGDTVTWSNGDPFDHSVVSSDDTFESDTLGTGAQFAHTFDTAGSFSYICGIHPSMSGEIEVTG